MRASISVNWENTSILCSPIFSSISLTSSRIFIPLVVISLSFSNRGSSHICLSLSNPSRIYIPDFAMPSVSIFALMHAGSSLYTRHKWLFELFPSGTTRSFLFFGQIGCNFCLGTPEHKWFYKLSQQNTGIFITVSIYWISKFMSEKLSSSQQSGVQKVELGIYVISIVLKWCTTEYKSVSCFEQLNGLCGYGIRIFIAWLSSRMTYSHSKFNRVSISLRTIP